jgi:hypothetical protein
MSPIKRLLHDFNTPPEATKSISVTPARVTVGRIQTPAQASRTFAAGLARQSPTGSAVTATKR